MTPLAKASAGSVGPKPITISRKILRAIGHLDPTGRVLDRLNQPKHYKNVVTTAEEAPRAADAYDDCHGANAVGTGVPQE